LNNLSVIPRKLATASPTRNPGKSKASGYPLFSGMTIGVRDLLRIWILKGEKPSGARKFLESLNPNPHPIRSWYRFALRSRVAWTRIRQCDVMVHRLMARVDSTYLHTPTEKVSLVLIMKSAQSEALA
jgi:hypothetical protein